VNPSAPDLRDIHVPAAPGWWPPAPGWWIVGACVLLALVLVAVRGFRMLARRRWRRRVREEFDRLVSSPDTADPVARVAAVSRLLRRVTLVIDPQAAALPAEAWLAFLDARMPGDESPFHRGAGRALVDLPYRRSDDAIATANAADDVVALARRWLAHALPGVPARA
jgi:hypothetical protein